MELKTLTEIKALRTAAATVSDFWPNWRKKYLADSHCDKKSATFVSGDNRFAAFSFNLLFDAHAGYYGNSSCSRIFMLDNDLAQKYFTAAIQEMAEPLFQRAAELMLKDAASLTTKAETEIATLQAMIDEVRIAT